MADISQIKLPNGDTFDLVDEKSGYLTEETDPVFSASAAAGISAANITSWNKKVGIDELSIGYVNGNNIYISPSVRFSQQGDSEYSGKFYFVIPSSGTGISGYNQANTTIRTIRNGTDYENILAYTFTQSGLYQGYVHDGQLTGVQRIATLSDIPTVPTNVSSFTNDSGYLTLSTLPIYDGTVV